MANVTTTYSDSAFKTSILNPRKDVALVGGPASFLALAVNLGVPILSRRHIGGGGIRSAGGGLSFDVGRATEGMRLRKGVGWANDIIPRWFDRCETSGGNPNLVIIKNYVTKRLLPHHDLDRRSCEDDTNFLSPMVTEMRILAHQEILLSANIVSLIGISWNTRETNGRFWPELLLESAQYGNLNQFLEVSPDLSFTSNALMLMDIAAGLTFLHENGIVHCDVKPSNMLICHSPERHAEESNGVAPVIVKLCDFGCSVILSDYSDSHSFSIDVGTPGWMAPEIEQRLPIDGNDLSKVDVYGLGLTARLILTGQRPSPMALHNDSINERVPDANHDEDLPGIRNGPCEETAGKSAQRKRFETDEVEQMPLKRCDEGSKNGTQLCTGIGRHPKSSGDTDGLGSTAESGSRDVQLSALLWEALPQTLQQRPSDRGAARDVYDICKTHLAQYGIVGGIELPRSLLSVCSQRNYAISASKITTAAAPDFVTEKSIQIGLLPRQCKAELIQDLRRRVANNTSDAGECALQLAALTINGYVVSSPEKIKDEAENYLLSAVVLGNQVALCGAINVFKAMGSQVPIIMQQSAMDAFQSTEFQLQALTDAKMLFCPLSVPLPDNGRNDLMNAPFLLKRDLKPNLVALYTWQKEFKDDFDCFLRSRHCSQVLGVAPIYLLHPEGLDWPTRDNISRSNSMIFKITWESYFGFGNMSSHERNAFIDEIRESGTVNSPTEVGLTLLQLAACRGDEATALVLLDALSANVNDFGSTPNWTPLWLACFLGRIEMVKLLLDHSANLTCTDTTQGLTILHLLSQFHSPEDIRTIGASALAAGVGVNTKCDDGTTPLLAAMLAFDFSAGAATQFLLDNGADPLKETWFVSEPIHLPVSPLSLGVLKLDTRLLEQMISVVSLDSINETRRRRAASLMETGFQMMRSQTAFGAMLETGSKYLSLKQIMQIFVNVERFYPVLMKQSWTPLTFAYVIDRADLIELLLVIDPESPLEVEQDIGSSAGEVVSIPMEILSRQNARAMNVLIHHSMNILGSAEKCHTIISFIAREMPYMLLDTLSYLEDLPAEARGGMTIKGILETPHMDAAGIFDCIVLNGTSHDLSIAEALRVQYDLNHDAIQPVPPETTTLIGALIQWSFSYGYDRLAQIRYLLSLEPKPKISMPAGINLFSLVLELPDEFKAIKQLEILSLLLKSYPEIEYLTEGSLHRFPVIHTVAARANYGALHLMQEHVEISQLVSKFPFNHIHLRSILPSGASLLTMLDCCRFGIVEPSFAESRLFSSSRDMNEDISSGNDFDKSKRHIKKRQFYQYLRDQGAVHSWELDGYFISGRILYMYSVSTADFCKVLQRLTDKYSLDPWEHGPKPGSEYPYSWFPYAWRELQKSQNIFDKAKPSLKDLISSPNPHPSKTSPQTQLRLCELVWRGGNFCLHAWDLPFASAWLSESISQYFKTRVGERKRWSLISGDSPPYEALRYRESLGSWETGDVEMLPYNRSGRSWTENEARQLSEDIFQDWKMEFGGGEDNMLNELNGIAMSFY